MEIRGKCCLMCYMHDDELFIHNNSPIVDRLKVIYGTIKFDDTLKHGCFCLSCAGRVHQLYNFFIISIHVASMSLREDNLRCSLCQRKQIIKTKDVRNEVVDYMLQASLSEAFHRNPTSFQCCFSCYNFIDAYKELKDKLKVFEELKSSLILFNEL